MYLGVLCQRHVFIGFHVGIGSSFEQFLKQPHHHYTPAGNASLASDRFCWVRVGTGVPQSPQVSSLNILALPQLRFACWRPTVDGLHFCDPVGDFFGELVHRSNVEVICVGDCYYVERRSGTVSGLMNELVES